MKAVLIASSIGFALATGSASAADLYPLKAPPPPPVYTWTGCYVDGGVGYGMWKQDHYSDLETTTGTFQLTPTNSTGGEGWLGRVGAGCDYQVGSRWLIGAFGDYDFMSLSGDFTEPWFDYVGREKETGAWAVGARIGYLVTPKLLTYFDAGYTQARFGQINLSYNALPPLTPTGPTGNFIPANTYSGWFIGGGYEYALWDIVPIQGLFMRTEYRYASYRSAELSIGGPLSLGTGICDTTFTGCTGYSDHMQKDVQTVTTGVVWKFNFSSPCCALVTKD